MATRTKAAPAEPDEPKREATKTTAPSAGSASGAEVQISKLDSETLWVPIVGTTPLIVNKFSEKAKRMMLDAQQGRKSPKVARDPHADFEAALYRTKTGYGFPATAFKNATVGAARFYGKSVKMTELRQFLFFKGELSPHEAQPLVEILGSEPRMREDVCRNANGGADLRFRPEFAEWRAELQVVYVRSCLTRESVLSLIDAGGMGVGVGEWRPERKGDFGTYTIDPNREARW